MKAIDPELREFIRYDSETGKLFWAKPRRGVTVGSEAGCLNDRGYRRIMVKGACVKAHRLAWFLFHDEEPAGELDHINGDRDDNRIENLRVVTSRENNQNRSAHRNGRLLGATFHRHARKWHAQIRVGDTHKHLGYFETELEAHEAYMRACESLDCIGGDDNE